MKMSTTTRLFIGLVSVCAMFVLAQAIMQRQAIDIPRFLAILTLTLVASRFKVTLPGLTGSMSVTLPFILVSLVQLSFLETLIVTIASVLMQSFGSGQQKPKPIQLLFNVSNLANAIGLAYYAIHQGPVHFSLPVTSLLVAIAATVYFLANTVPVAAIISLTEGKNVVRIWHEVFMLSFPYYVVSAGLASMMTTMSVYVNWLMPAILLPVAFALYQSYKRYFQQPKLEKSLHSAAAMGMAASSAAYD